MRSLLLSVAFSLVLAACGGSSGSSSTPAPPQAVGPTSQELANAQAANVTASLEAPSNMATVSWSDIFQAGTSYTIEQQAQDGSWGSIDAVPGNSGSGSSLTWSRTVNVTTTLRVAVKRTDYEVPLDSAGGSPSVQVVVPASTPTIVLDQVPPISGTVNASIAGGGSYSSVAYYMDLNLAGTSTTGPGYTVSLDTSGLTATSHLVLARLATAPDSYIELRLPVQVANPEVAVQVTLRGVGLAPATSGPLKVSVAATSSYSMTSVSASLDGRPLGTLAAPNGCDIISGLCPILDRYQFPVDATAAGSGTHTITAQATDANGATASRVITVVFNNPPTLTLTSPFDGELVNGNLQIAATFGTDKPATTVALSVTLGSLPVVNTSTSPVNSSFSLGGVTPGSYTLTATATDSSGLSTTVNDLVTVTSSPSLVYSPILTLGAGGSILAASGTYILYSSPVPDGSIHLRSGNTDKVVPLGAIQSPFNWTVTDNGYVLAQGAGGDRPNATVSIYMWPPGGVAENLSIASGSTSIDDQLLQVHYPWVLWLSSFQNSNGAEDVLYNISTGQQFHISSPHGLGSIYSDFFTANSNLTLFYWDLNQATGASNVLRWDQATNTTVPITSDGLSLYPQTDGTMVAWKTLQESPPSTTSTFTLTTRDLASTTTTVLSTNTATFTLSSGLLGWLDQTLSGFTVASQAIKAWDGTTTSTVSTQLGTVFFGSSGGYIFFEEGGKLYAWSSSSGRQLLFDVAPGQVRLTGKTIYFTNGTSQTVYGVTLD
jgi:hypothetical protein